MAFSSLLQNPDVLITLLISAAVNVFAVLLAFIEPYKSVLRHAWVSWTHGGNDKIHALMYTKTGKMQWLYEKPNADGTLEFNNNQYTLNNKSTYSYKGIPTQVYVEGQAAPHDVFDEQENSHLTTRELNTIMLSKDLPGILELMKQYLYIAGIIAAVAVALALASIYMNYNIFDVVVQGGQGLLGNAGGGAAEVPSNV